MISCVNIVLTQDECRELGSLIEKDNTTPDNNPISLNEQINACNQKSNREPVTSLDEASVHQALHNLELQSLVRSVSPSDSRVTKYEHRLQEAFNFYRHETAILCVLLLRGPQTPGELRMRAELMHHFEDLSAVHSGLQHLMKREPSLVKVLPRQPGTKESRYAHLLAGEVESNTAESVAAAEDSQELTAAPVNANRLVELQDEVAGLRADVAGLRSENAELRESIANLAQQFAEFRRQFD